jgi:cytochrome P450
LLHGVGSRTDIRFTAGIDAAPALPRAAVRGFRPPVAGAGSLARCSPRDIIAIMQPAANVLPPKYDPHDSDAQENPYQVYAKLRRAGPLCRGGPGQWFVTRYSSIAELLRNPGLGHQVIDQHQKFSADEPVTGFFQNIIFERDPPRHTRLRQLLRQAFDSALVARVVGRIRTAIDELLEPALDRCAFDAVSDFAVPIPALVVGELLSIPRADLNAVYTRAKRLSTAFDMRYPPNQDRDGANDAVTWLRQYIRRLLEQRRNRPGEDVLSRMLSVRGLLPSEAVDNSIFLFFSGLETTKDLISIGCAALVQHQDELARLRADRSLLPTAIDEFLRYDAPIQALARLVREPIEIGGRVVRPGRMLMLLLGSGNHDEQQFVAPDRLDIGRRPNPHLSFGGGDYYCLGAVLTRAAAVTTFERLLEQSSTLEATAPPVRRKSALFRGYQSVPIAIHPK